MSQNQPKPEEKKPEAAKLKKILVTTVKGEMTHLFTNQVINGNPQLVINDQFTQNQIEAGKWVEVAAE